MTTIPSDGDATIAAIREQYAQLLERLKANEREFRRLGRAVWRVQEDEQRRLARELHDGIGQNLTALKHRLSRLESGLAPAQRAQLGEAIALCASTLDDTRALSRLLRPPILDDLGLEPALRWLARSIAESSDLALDVQVEPLPALDSDVQTLLFRIAQEALNNVAKHAHASSAVLRVVARDDRVLLQCADDGRGCDPAQAMRSGGSGLGGMRERLRLFEGSLELHSVPGEGTRLRVNVPIDGRI